MTKYSSRMYCFSPPVMIATFAIELGLAMYVIWKFRNIAITRILVATLLSLATFQLAEWMVCQGAMGVSSIDWARIGFVSISFLPPLGIHIATMLAGKPTTTLTYAGYAGAVAFSGYFIFATQGISGSVCGGNYVIFEMAPTAVNMFSLYYYSMLLLGATLSLLWAKQTTDRHAASALKGLAAGYAAFMVPTMAVYQLDNETSAGIPSIMCGFAIMLALTLVFWVLPRHLESSYVVDNGTAGGMRPINT